MVRLKTLKSWKSVREDTALAVKDFPETDLDYKPLTRILSFQEIARHILDSTLGLQGLPPAGETNFATPDFREKLKPYRSGLSETADAQMLSTALRSALESRTIELLGQPESFYSEEVTRMDGQKMTRLEMLQFTKEHEICHRAQLFMYLRLKGIVPATPRRRMAAKASA